MRAVAKQSRNSVHDFLGFFVAKFLAMTIKIKMLYRKNYFQLSS